MLKSNLLPYACLLLFSAIASGVMAVRAYRARRKVVRTSAFAVMAIFGAIWMVLAALDMPSAALFWKEILWRLTPFAILNTLIGLVFFSVEFSLRLKRLPGALLFITITLTLGLTTLSLTNGVHHLVWTVAEVNGRYVQVPGPLFYLQYAFAYLLLLVSAVFLLRAYILTAGILRRQTLYLLIGIAIPVTVSLVTDGLGWNPLPQVDLTALSMIFTMLLFGRVTLRFQTLQLMPVASDVVIQNMRDGILVADPEGMIIFSNPAAQRIFGKPEAQISGHLVTPLLAAWLPEAAQAWKDRNDEVQLVVGADPALFFRFTVSKLVSPGNDSLGYLLALYNNTEQKNYEQRLNELAICDPLTGSYNRRYFYEMAQSYFEQMLRFVRPFSILMLDLDHFKQINDTYGHLKGDLVLQKVAATCKSLVRAPDLFSRYGGEEFVLAMPETSAAQALVVAERLRRAIEALRGELDGIPVTASLGLVEACGEPGLTLDLLLQRADDAMYASKDAGRNRVTLWTPDLPSNPPPA